MTMIFLVGPHGAGKSEIAKILSEQYNFLNIETGEAVRAYKQKAAPTAEMNAWLAAVGQREVYDAVVDDIFERANATDSKGNPFTDVIFNGVRAPEGIQFILDNAWGLPEVYREQFHIIGVTAETSILFERFKGRNRHPGDREMSFDHFQTNVLGADSDKPIAELLQIADFVIENNFVGSNRRTHLEELVGAQFGTRLGYFEYAPTPIEGTHPKGFYH